MLLAYITYTVKVIHNNNAELTNLNNKLEILEDKHTTQLMLKKEEQNQELLVNLATRIAEKNR